MLLIPHVALCVAPAYPMLFFEKLVWAIYFGYSWFGLAAGGSPAANSCLTVPRLGRTSSGGIKWGFGPAPYNYPGPAQAGQGRGSWRPPWPNHSARMLRN